MISGAGIGDELTTNWPVTGRSPRFDRGIIIALAAQQFGQRVSVVACTADDLARHWRCLIRSLSSDRLRLERRRAGRRCPEAHPALRSRRRSECRRSGWRLPPCSGWVPPARCRERRGSGQSTPISGIGSERRIRIELGVGRRRLLLRHRLGHMRRWPRRLRRPRTAAARQFALVPAQSSLRSLTGAPEPRQSREIRLLVDGPAALRR